MAQRCQWCRMDIFPLGNGDWEDELGFVSCPARKDDDAGHRPLLTIVED